MNNSKWAPPLYNKSLQPDLMKIRRENIRLIFLESRRLYYKLFNEDSMNDNSCWVETERGVRFNILASCVKDDNLTIGQMLWLGDSGSRQIGSDIWSALKRTTRYNGNKNISVAEHLTLATDLAKLFYPNHKDIIKEVLLHDIHEAIVGDIIFPIRKMFPDFEELEANISDRLKMILFPSYIGGNNEVMEESVRIIDHLTFLVEKSRLGILSDEEWNLKGRNFDVIKQRLIKNLTLQEKHLDESIIHNLLSSSDFEFYQKCNQLWDNRKLDTAEREYKSLLNQ